MTDYGYGEGTPIPVVPTIETVGVEPYPLLSLEEFREEIGYNPWHFWGLSGAKAPLTSNCNSVVNEFAWQAADAAGRYDIRRAIMRAEEKIRPWLGYSIAPAYREVSLQWPRFPQPNIYNVGYGGSDWRWISLQLPEGEIQALGVQVVSLKAANTAITYSDPDGDGLDERWSVTLAVPGATDAEQVAVYQSAAYRLNGKGLVESTRIHPINVVYDPVSGLFTISGPTWLMVRPILYQSPGPLDPSVAANFMTTIDVATRVCNGNGATTDTCHATLIWETPLLYDPASTGTAMARGTLRNAKHGTIGLGEATYDATTGVWTQTTTYDEQVIVHPPDRVIVRYLAGKASEPGGRVAEDMRTLLVPLAAAELHRKICGCQEANRVLYDYQFDCARSGGNESYPMMTREMLNNPFGTKRGEIDTWLKVKGKRLLTGFSV